MRIFSIIRESKLIPAVVITYFFIRVFNQELILKVQWLNIFNSIVTMILLFLLGLELYISSKNFRKKFENEEFDDLF
ncbi:hypothetical protein [Clostridium sp.]|uniref:hypothetical protein n=1 Tax=Clostridium sp. TaxID=1506 RepID=UPI00399529D4